jgi:hypothetical protein
LGGITKRGNRYLRRLLINGASANLLRSKATKADPWVIGAPMGLRGVWEVAARGRAEAAPLYDQRVPQLCDQGSLHDGKGAPHHAVSEAARVLDTARRRGGRVAAGGAQQDCLPGSSYALAFFDLDLLLLLRRLCWLW